MSDHSPGHAPGTKKTIEDDDAVYCMRPEEEAALLAEYGVQGPMDGLMEVEAASRFRSGYGADVFLTGGVAEEEGDANGGVLDYANITQEELLWDPLEALLLKHTSSLTAITPPNLVQHVAQTIETLRAGVSTEELLPSQLDRGGAEASMKYRNALKINREMELEMQYVCEGMDLAAAHVKVAQTSPTQEQNRRRRHEPMMQDLSSDPLVDETDRLLRQAQEYLSVGKTQHIDCSRDVELQTRLKLLREEEEILGADVYDQYLEKEDLLDDEAEDEQLLQRARELTERLQHLMAESNKYSEPSTTPATNNDASPPPPLKESPADDDWSPPEQQQTAKSRMMKDMALITLPSLYAFEFCPSTEETAPLREWERLLEQAEQRLQTSAPAVAMASPSLELSAPNNTTTTTKNTVDHLKKIDANVLESIQSMEQRDQALEEHTQKAMRAVVKEGRERRSAARAAELKQQKDARGLLALEPFVDRMDALIPPSEHEVKLRREMEMAATTTTTTTEDQQQVHASSPGKEVGEVRAKNLEQIQRRAARDNWLVAQEAAEYKRLREEDARMTRMLAHFAALLENVEEAMAQCFKDADAGHSSIVEEEESCREDLHLAEQRRLALTKQAINLRFIAVTAQLSNDVFTHYSAICTRIEEEQLAQLDALRLAEKSGRQAVVALLSEREEEHVRQLRAQRKQLEDEYVSHVRHLVLREVAHDAMVAGCSTYHRSLATSRAFSGWSTMEDRSLRMSSLLQEHSIRREWGEQNSKKIEHVKEALSHALLRLQRNCPKTEVRDVSATAMTSSRPTTANLGAPAPAEVEGCLNSEVARSMQSLSFAAAEHDLFRAPLILSSLSFVLEHLRRIDCASLASMMLRARSHHPAPHAAADDGSARRWMQDRGTPVCPLVRELDLSSNEISHLSLEALLSTFTSLKTLRINDNKVSTLEEDAEASSPSARGVNAAQLCAFSRTLAVAQLDISSNALTTLEPIGRLLSYSLTTLHAYANHISSVSPLSTCEHLTQLHLNRNRIDSVEDLAPLSLLQELNLCDNQLTSLDSIAHAHAILQKLFISSNRLVALPSPSSGSLCWMFLTQLFMNRNALVALRQEHMPWMPMLEVLHAEANRIQDISGLAQCPRLRTLKLSFNALRHFSDLRPLAACQRLDVLDVSENPFVGQPAPLPAPDAPTENQPKPQPLLPWMRDALLRMLPHLRELNNDVLVRMSLTEQRELPTLPHEVQMLLATSCCRSHSTNALHRLWSMDSGAGLLPAYGRTFSALCGDAFITDMRTSMDVAAIDGSRRLRSAELIEEELRERLQAKHLHYTPAVHRLSTSVQWQRSVDAVSSMQEHLQRMSAFTSNSELYYANVHVSSSWYSQQRRLHVEQQAKKQLNAWVYGRILIRRARKELLELRAAYQKSLGFRREMAARRIQPVWRGAALRSRLKRILRPKPEDEDEFAAVVDEFNDIDMPQLEGMGAMLKKAMEEVSGAPFTRFDVPATLPFQPAPPPPRAGSAPTQDAQLPPRLALGNRPSSVTTENTAPPTSREALEAQWGSQVASQIMKRKKKMTVASHKQARMEFISDPLKAKRDLRGR